jgi:hypothetical protein
MPKIPRKMTRDETNKRAIPFDVLLDFDHSMNKVPIIMNPIAAVNTICEELLG